MATEKNPNNFKFSPWWIYAGLIIAFFGLNYIGGSGFQETAKISSSKFNEYLDKGQIEKVVIYNKTEGEAYLTAAALKDKTHSKLANISPSTRKLKKCFMQVCRRASGTSEPSDTVVARVMARCWPSTSKVASRLVKSLLLASNCIVMLPTLAMFAAS